MGKVIFRIDGFEDNEVDLSEDVIDVLLGAIDLFSEKSKDYTSSSGKPLHEDSGLMGQYLKLRDKIEKLRKTMWDAEIIREARALGVTASNGDLTKLRFEDTEEILNDVIGHCILAISILRKRDKADRRKDLEEGLLSTIVGELKEF
jgi:hypothetical protein